MRHLLSVVLSIILAPLTYVAAGYAAVKLDAAHLSANASDIDWNAAWIGLAAGVAAGALYAVLVMARLSPVGPVLAGLLFLGVTLWAFLNSASFAKVFDFNLFGEKQVLLRPVGAGTLLLSIPLIATVFSPRRWSGATQPAIDGVEGAPATAAPAYGEQPAFAAPTYAEAQTYAGPAYADQQTYAPQTYADQQTYAAPAYGSPYPGESTPVYQPPAGTAAVFAPPASEPAQTYTPPPAAAEPISPAYTPPAAPASYTPYQPPAAEPVSPPAVPSPPSPATAAAPEWPTDRPWPRTPDEPR